VFPSRAAVATSPHSLAARWPLTARCRCTRAASG
jgi:hypothetical protein